MAAWRIGPFKTKTKTSEPAQPGETPPKASAQAVVQITEEMIARRAHEIWEAKGRPEGQSEHNWLEAEAQLRATRQTS